MDLSFLKTTYFLPEIDFLSLEEVYAIPGVRQLCDKSAHSLPKPDHDLSKAMRKGECPTSHYYWNRSTITAWLAKNTQKSTKTTPSTKGAVATTPIKAVAPTTIKGKNASKIK